MTGPNCRESIPAATYPNTRNIALCSEELAITATNGVYRQLHCFYVTDISDKLFSNAWTAVVRFLAEM
jgi:hypothetical protein